MMQIIKYGFSIIIVVFLKLQYGRKMSINWRQLLHPSTVIKIDGNGKVSLGRITRTRRNCTLLCLDGELVIGKGLFMNQNAMITCVHSIEIGDNVTIANNVVIVDHDHNYKKDVDTQFVSQKVTIGDNTWVGANVTILKGANIGHDCVIAAGTVVRQGNYPPFSIIYNKQDIAFKSYK